MYRTLWFSAIAVALFIVGCEPTATDEANETESTDREVTIAPEETVPDWAKDAVFYQIFPERFANGDRENDPPREMLEFPYDHIPESWEVREWTSDWYDRSEWEEEVSDDFYDTVFDRRYGGDLQGVMDRLDYLEDLGINTIYFNPIFWGRSLHKYDGNSFHHVDPHFGPDPEGDFELMEQEDPTDPDTWVWTSADRLFLDLLEAADERGIRVIIDGVFNHTGRDFFAFADIRENQEDSEFADWYVVHSFEDGDDPGSEFEYDAWWGFERLPEFNLNDEGDDLHPEPKAYVMNSTERWMQPEVDGEPRQGVAGWRLDVVEELPDPFWQDWNAHVRELNPEAYTVAEVWNPAADYIQRAGFSATMNYHAFAFPVKGFLVDGAIPPSEFASLLNDRREDHTVPQRYVHQNLIDSHDTERVASSIVNRDTDYERPDRFDFDVDERVSPRHYGDYDVRKPNEEERQIQRLVALFQLTYKGAPMIYYGTEAGMWGGDDPDDRKPMVWPDYEYEDETEHPLDQQRPADEVYFDDELFAYYQDVIALRNEHEALRRGGFEVAAADDERDVFAYERTLDEESVLVVLNRSEDAHSMRLPVEHVGEYELAFITRDDSHRVQRDDEALLLELAGHFGMVFTR